MLRAEENLALRAGVIAGGGLVGLLVGMMRGRFIKRLFYTRYMLFKSLLTSITIKKILFFIKSNRLVRSCDNISKWVGFNLFPSK
jgi:hypothetical protein